ncbi:serine/threonine protein phosphatase [Rhodobacteraceae bacterium NNCM2]|nr:serine/threonine protein phosphatase [Coraliihabitans acroporae]
MPFLDEASVPPGLRIYAIGDVHGCRDELAEIHGRIRADLAARPCPDWRIIHLGDYVDRGPDIKGVISDLVRQVRDRRSYALLGNHDHMFVEFLGDAASASFLSWITYGGVATIEAYGAVFEPGIDEDIVRRRALREELLSLVPEDHLRFLSTLPHSLRFGDFLFVHAGIRPGVPIDRQSVKDMIWIRDPFLSSTGDLGAVVVHGHTVGLEVVVRDNRIGIDTGAVHGGHMTCLILEQDQKMLLNASGPEPLTR